ncbi:MAG TPA: transposase, partial [Polyangiaceae bacterium]
HRPRGAGTRRVAEPGDPVLHKPRAPPAHRVRRRTQLLGNFLIRRVTPQSRMIRHRTLEFTKFDATLEREVSDGLEVRLVLDNYATHKRPAVKAWLMAHPRFHLHFTPTGSSWLNPVEGRFAELTNKRTRRGVHTSVHAPESDIRDWNTTWNTDPKPYVWAKTTDQTLERLAG